MERENILLVKGKSQYDAMRIYIDELALAFRKKGFNTLVIDGCNEGIKEELEAVRKMRFKFVLTMNAIGLEKKFDYYSPDVVNCTYLCDHPGTHSSRLCNADANDMVIVCDDNFRKYINRFFPNVKKCAFVPLSGSAVDEYIPYEKRKIDMVFTGTYISPAEKKEQILLSLDAGMRGFVEEMMEFIIENPDDTIEQCLEKVLVLKGIRETISEEKFHELVCNLMVVDSYARFYYRDKILRIIVESGIHIHVFGNGWEKFDMSDRENFVIEKGNSYLAQKAVANAKISLNMMPWFKAGFQERIVSAMLSGAVALTDSSEYIDENFVDGKDLVLYSLKELDKLPHVIQRLLDDPKYAKKIAEEGRNKAKKEHAWLQRAEQILDLVNEFQGVENTEQCEGDGEEIELIGIKRDLSKTLANSITELDRLIEVCRQIRKNSYFTFGDVYKIQKETKKLVNLLNSYFDVLDVNTFAFFSSPDEIAAIIRDPGIAGAMLENYLQNIFGQILSFQYDALWNQLEVQQEVIRKLEEKNNSIVFNRDTSVEKKH